MSGLGSAPNLTPSLSLTLVRSLEAGGLVVSASAPQSDYIFQRVVSPKLLEGQVQPRGKRFAHDPQMLVKSQSRNIPGNPGGDAW